MSKKFRGFFEKERGGKLIIFLSRHREKFGCSFYRTGKTEGSVVFRIIL